MRAEAEQELRDAIQDYWYDGRFRYLMAEPGMVEIVESVADERKAMLAAIQKVLKYPEFSKDEMRRILREAIDGE